MAEAATKLPVKTETSSAAPSKVLEWRPFEGLRHQVDRLFRDFETGFLQSPLYRDVDNFWRRDLAFPVTPAVDIVEKDHAFEMTAELPGLDAKNVELSLSDDVLRSRARKRKRRKKRPRTATSPSVAMVPSGVLFNFPPASMPARSKQATRAVFSPLRCRSPRKRRRSRP